MPQQSYNFFGLGPAQQQAPPDPSLLALQQFNNPTSSQTQPSQGGINPQMLAKAMMNKQQSPTIAQASGAAGNSAQMGYVGDFPASMPTSSPGLWQQLSGLFGGGNGGS